MLYSCLYNDSFRSQEMLCLVGYVLFCGEIKKNKN